jgi:hypothetical protein
MSDDRHRYFVTVEGDCYPSVRCECPYELSDRERPCWPRLNDGSLDEMLNDECNHVSWLENIGWEMVAGSRTFQVEATFDWSYGDCPVLDLVGEEAT